MISSKLEDYRCCSCGTVHRLLSRPTMRDVPCPTCGPGHEHYIWCVVGSFTEYDRWYRRREVCRVGDHIAGDARQYTFVHPEAPCDDKTVERVYLRCCLHHLSELDAFVQRHFPGYLMEGQGSA